MSDSDKPYRDGLSGRFVWFYACATISFLLVMATAANRLAVASGLTAIILRNLDLAVENNLAVWWSGMLLFIIGLHAYDGSARYRSTSRTRSRAWVVIASVLVFFSLDEIASVHERLADFSRYLGLNNWTLILMLA